MILDSGVLHVNIKNVHPEKIHCPGLAMKQAAIVLEEGYVITTKGYVTASSDSTGQDASFRQPLVEHCFF